MPSAVRHRDNFGGADDSVLASDVTTRSPIRGVLIAGLLVLFVLWVATGYELIRSLADAERRVSEVHAEFIRGEETLSAIRTSVLLGSIYLRDALIDVTDKRQYYRDELRRIQGDIEKRLPQLSSPEGLGGDQHELKE